MPELPEMENYKILLSELIVNRPITAIAINREKSINIPIPAFLNQMQNASIIRIERRAKHLLFHLSNQKILLLHLMLGGWMFYGKEEEKPKRTIQIQFSFGEKHLYFIGLRLGYLHLLTLEECKEKLKELGPEPFNSTFTEELFIRTINTKRGNLKLKLVDQHFIAGIGNCYSDEICYEAQLLPTRKLEDLKEPEMKNLFRSIKNTLTLATNIGGYMEHPLYLGDTKTGSYNDICKVYDREGEACPRCQNKIKKIKISSKKSFYCPGCQF
ncbi:Fpg/Nei family DNA glycosylase [Niallia sp. Sow4_A1]|uniref:Fpg/Nei family DNA glycosylase n=1 Tax=Bacillaceae TaxID=186817 RepID=UPI001F1FB98C|nr:MULTISPECIES: DNA-formamidopyrimidine glycosylase family protein [Bacillaceae]MCF2650214.1 Fpg/Nei family DNA glycosylase [Niallia circulans]MCM3362222.1 endonuclease VIII [Niallia sp. MER TA 168]CAI9394501.1 Formamidopyrimidine-DNA glycosylase [Bacillus sp. T2.9-1]